MVDLVTVLNVKGKDETTGSPKNSYKSTWHKSEPFQFKERCFNLEKEHSPELANSPCTDAIGLKENASLYSIT